MKTVKMDGLIELIVYFFLLVHEQKCIRYAALGIQTKSIYSLECQSARFDIMKTTKMQNMHLSLYTNYMSLVRGRKSLANNRK